jgi:hypothetical protein
VCPDKARLRATVGAAGHGRAGARCGRKAGEDAGAVGAAALVVRSLFASSVPVEEQRSLEGEVSVSRCSRERRLR